MAATLPAPLRPRHPIAFGLVLVVVLASAACGRSGQNQGSDRLVVVATTTVIADFVENVGGTLTDVSSLVPPGGEPHTFDPSPSDVTRLEGAAIVFQNGLGLDDWLGDLIADAESQARLVALGEGLDGVEYLRTGEHAGADENSAGGEGTDEDGAIDPHLWLNAAYARKYVERIAEELAVVDPRNAGAFRANAAAYGQQLDAVDAYARSALDDIPETRRAVVSFHEGFGYFARAYGLTVVDTVVGAPGQDPSAGEVAALIDEIRGQGVRAILAETQFPTDLVDRIAEETGATVVSDLFSDTLGDPPIDSYLSGLRFDVDAIAASLR